MTKDRADRLRWRVRGQRQLAVSTVGLAVLSAAGVGAVAAQAAHDFANKADTNTTPDAEDGYEAPTQPPPRLPQTPATAPQTNPGIAPVTPTRQRPAARSGGS